MAKILGRSLRAALPAAAFAATLVANAADLTGTVRFPNGQPARNAVVWLQGAVQSQPMKNAVVDQRDLTFIPHVSVVTVGTRVRFPNDDTVYHNVFAEFQAKRFDLGMYPRGATKAVTFGKAGLVALLCSVHSDMSAYIMVVDTPYYAVTDGKGRFHISGIASGAYTLQAWHESKNTFAGPISIGQGHQEQDVRISRG